MPRLVSLTLLSVLVLPAAALLYVVVVVIGDDWRRGWSTDRVFLTANGLSFALVVGWWLVLWGRSVEWSAIMISLTLLGTGGSILLAVMAGFAAGAAISDDFGLFVGGVTAIVSWLVCACILWRRGGRGGVAPAEGGTAGAHLVICPKCGYALNGLREARCPECGEVYTLDALMLSQPGYDPGGDLDRSGGAGAATS